MFHLHTYTADILCVNVERKCGGVVQQVSQKMVSHSLYEQSQNHVKEQEQAIAILKQKVILLFDL